MRLYFDRLTLEELKNIIHRDECTSVSVDVGSGVVFIATNVDDGETTYAFAPMELTPPL